jgi:penicillin-binding protein 2
MATANDIIERLPRVIWFGVILALGLGLLAVRLWWLQVVDYSKYGESGEKQSLRTVRLPAARGRIFDRNGVCLVDNRPLYSLALYLEELRTHTGRKGARKGKKETLRLIHDKLDSVSAQIRYPLAIQTNVVRKHVDELMPLPLTVAENLPEDAVARFYARSDRIPGMDLQVGAQRSYPHGSLAAHVLGYVGRTSFPPGEQLGEFYYYMPDMIGKEGIEAQFDGELRGAAGGKSLTVDVAGYKHREVGIRLPQAGRNIRLTLDARIQKIVEDAMGDRVGAAVIVDPRNGDILAMCSVPSYDPNQFFPRLREELFLQLIGDPDKPFLNRAISAYEPGSTFKVVTALAGLELGKITPSTESDCQGIYYIGKQAFRCWIHSRGGAHGRVDFLHAIKFSCNVFFYEHGVDIGGTNIVAMAQQFKLGEPTGVPLGAYVYDEAIRNYRLRDVEADGGLPSPDILRMKGHVANMSIGQGDVRTTPLQMAYLTAAIANGGILWAPRLVDAFELQDESLPRAQRIELLPPQIRSKPNVSRHNLDLVRDAMFHVVEDDDGTAHKARVAGVRIAGKTGTAQYKKRDADTGETIQGHHVWYIGFAPFEEPRYAMAIMVEEGDSGGTTCAPIAGQIYRKLFEMEKGEKTREVIGNRLTGNWESSVTPAQLPVTNYQLPITAHAP